MEVFFALVAPVAASTEIQAQRVDDESNRGRQETGEENRQQPTPERNRSFRAEMEALVEELAVVGVQYDRVDHSRDRKQKPDERADAHGGNGRPWAGGP